MAVYSSHIKMRLNEIGDSYWAVTSHYFEVHCGDFPLNATVGFMHYEFLGAHDFIYATINDLIIFWPEISIYAVLWEDTYTAGIWYDVLLEVEIDGPDWKVRIYIDSDLKISASGTHSEDLAVSWVSFYLGHFMQAGSYSIASLDADYDDWEYKIDAVSQATDDFSDGVPWPLHMGHLYGEPGVYDFLTGEDGVYWATIQFRGRRIRRLLNGSVRLSMKQEYLATC